MSIPKEEKDIIKELGKMVPEFIKENLSGPLKTLAKFPDTFLDPSSVQINELEKAVTKQLNHTDQDINQQASIVFLARLISQYCSDNTSTTDFTPIKQSASSIGFFHQPASINHNEVANSHQDKEENPFMPQTP